MYFLIHLCVSVSDTLVYNPVVTQLLLLPNGPRSVFPGPDVTPYSVVLPSFDVCVNGPDSERVLLNFTGHESGIGKIILISKYR